MPTPSTPDGGRGSSRRGLLLGGGLATVAAVVGVGELVEHDVLPGREQARSILHLNGSPGRVPNEAAAPVRRGTTDGVDWALCTPPGSPADGLPLVVALGGRSQSRGYLLETLALPRFLTASGLHVAVLAVAGGSSYYHRRDDGSDVGGLVLDTLLPAVGRLGVAVDEPAFLGWSMGGYGALLLAAELAERGRPVAGVAAVSPAIFTSYGEAAPGAYDSAKDFERYDVHRRTRTLRHLPVKVWCGTGDPFRYTSQDLAEQVRAPYASAPGAHDAAYWRRVLPAQLRWLGRRL